MVIAEEISCFGLTMIAQRLSGPSLMMTAKGISGSRVMIGLKEYQTLRLQFYQEWGNIRF